MPTERIYLDYNATAPLAKKVKSFLASGDFIDANPTSQHTAGKKARKILINLQERLLSHFSLSSDNFDIVLHSGATEGINFIFQGFLKQNPNCLFLFSKMDHKCVLEQKNWLEKLGAKVELISVDSLGQLNLAQIEEILKSNKGVKTLLNITAVNNETGHIQSLNEIENLKLKFSNLIIHVDAAQLVGKIKYWNKLNKNFEYYTFSGHKFGALKSSGFSFLNKKSMISPLVYGGGQQKGLRSGTENLMAAQSLVYALDEMKEKFDEENLKKFKQSILELFKPYHNKVLIFDENTGLNTVSVIFKLQTSDKILPFFDLSNLDVSNGSSCRSGITTESYVISALGYSEYSKNLIRISFPYYDFDKALIISKMKECLSKIFS